MMTLGATLCRLHLQSPQPELLATFYARAYGLTITRAADVQRCEGPARRIHISAGVANQLHHALYAFSDPRAWADFCQRTASLPRGDTPLRFDLPPEAVVFRDPDGNLMAFALMAEPKSAHTTQGDLQATNQHFALRTTRVDEMLAFYEQKLGFVLSDRVLDSQGKLRACFLRTDSLHHSLALFGSPVTCFDHQSFEAPTWGNLKDWADHMSRERIEIVWGVGRHGPGNDVFFMVRDPDGNLAEISAEIETCAPERAVGTWPHEERTLNLWGKAILRS